MDSCADAQFKEIALNYNPNVSRFEVEDGQKLVIPFTPPVLDIVALVEPG